MPRRRSWSRLVLAGLVGSITLVGSAEAQIYRWQDAEGREHFAQDLQSVPPAHREQARQRWSESGRRVNLGATGASRTGVEPAPGRDARPGAPSRRPPPIADPDRPGGRSESEWRASFARHLRAVETAREAVAAIEAGSAAPDRVDYSYRGRRSRERARWERGRQLRENQRAKAESLARAQARLAEAERGLAEFRERARRAGVPPGWIRMP